MKKLVVCFLTLLAFGAKAQQEALYSQYMFNGLVVNPAYAGYKEDINVSLLGRTQWVGIKGAPNTQSLIADGAFFENKNVGLGLAVVNDRVNIQGQTSAMLNYAYRLPVGSSDGRLSFGVAGGVSQFSLYGDEASVDDQTDPNFGARQTVFSPDARAGMFYSTDKFYVGLSATNLLSRALNRSRTQANYVVLPYVHVFLTAGALVDVNNFVKFKPSIMLRDDPKGMGNADFNASFLFNDKVWLGASYRAGVDMWKNTNIANATFQQNSLIGLVEVYFARQFRIGYAYDYSLSSLNSYSNGSHEISLGLIINGNRRNTALTSPRYF